MIEQTVLQISSIDIPYLLFIFSFIAGFFDAIAGGGALILIPVLLINGFSASNTVAQNKLIGTPGAVVSMLFFIKHRQIDWKTVLVGFPLTLVGALIGAHTISMISDDVAEYCVLILLPIAALFLWKYRCVSLVNQRNAASKFLIIAFLFIGFYDGFFGPGTGCLLILTLSNLKGLSLLKSAGTAKVFNATTNVAALTVFLMNDSVMIAVGLVLALANILGNLVGSKIAMFYGEKIVRNAIIFMLPILVITIFYRAIV